MKKIYLSIVAIGAAMAMQAQVAVTFSVDMSGVPGGVSGNGVHLAGNFNDPDYDGGTFPNNYNAAYPNWNPSAIQMTDADMDMIYTVTLNLNPARYEFKFINDNNWGPGEEGIPATCQVGGGNSNREIFVANTATSYNVAFASCAPTGQYAIRFRVDMTTQPGINPIGVHVAGEFQNPQWTADASPLRDDDDNGIWEGYYIVGTTTTFQYKYINGNDFADPNENVSGSCSAGNGNRTVTLTETNTLLPVYCYGQCDPCVEPSLITFRVNMTNSCIDTTPGVNLMGTVTNWGSGSPMSDNDQDGIWELTLPVAPGNYAYKFRVGGNNWEGFPGDRSLTVAAGVNQTLEAFCWGLSTPCGPFFPPANITFQLDPVQTVPVGQYCWVMGDFTGWQGGAIQMTEGANGIWETVVPNFCPQVLSYKFVIGADNTNTANNWLEESADFSAIGGCGIDNGAFSDNRFFARTSGDPVTLGYKFDSCEPAIVSVEEYSAISSVQLYPVPADEQLNIKFTSLFAQNIQARLINNVGQVVLFDNLGTVAGKRQIQMNVANLANGLYTVELIGQSGKISKLIAIQ